MSRRKRLAAPGSRQISRQADIADATGPAQSRGAAETRGASGFSPTPTALAAEREALDERLARILAAALVGVIQEEDESGVRGGGG